MIFGLGVVVDIDQPILKKLSFLLDTSVEALLEFKFENLACWCMKCGLITHFGYACVALHKIPKPQVSFASISKFAGGLFSSLGSKIVFIAGSA